MTADDGVHNASKAFYAALNRMANGDASAMADVWSHDAGVTTMHPIGGREVGWEAVRESWEQVAQLAADGSVELTDRQVTVAGDMACEVGIEKGRITLAGQEASIEHRVTNVYQREGDAWKIVHHHTDLSPAMLEILKSL